MQAIEIIPYLLKYELVETLWKKRFIVNLKHLSPVFRNPYWYAKNTNNTCGNKSATYKYQICLSENM